MATIQEQYIRELYQQRGYFAAWEPMVAVRLGHCGPVEDYVFKPQGVIGQWGITFEADASGHPADIDYSSKDGLTATFQLRGGSHTIPSIPQGSAGLKLEFTRQEAVAVALKGARQTSIGDHQRLKRDLLAAVASRDPFPDGWFVVTDLMECAFASVVIAQGRGATFAVTADADFSAGLVDLANANLSFTVADERQVGYRMLAQSGATPLFRGVRVKRSWLGKVKFEELDAGSRSGEQLEEMFEPASPDTVAESVAS